MTIDCPRCGATVEQENYGPCAECRAELCSWADWLHEKREAARLEREALELEEEAA